MPELPKKDEIIGRIKSIDKQQLFFILMLFMLAFGVRSHLLKYDYLFGFDSYFHARMTGILIETGEIPTVDPLAYYSVEGGMGPPQNVFFWQFSALLYNVATLGGAYNKELWIMFVKVLPALFGALTAAAMYFLGKEMYGRKAGYSMALIAAVVPSFVYRTLAGFFEEDSLGFLWLIIGLVFFVRAVKDPVFNRKGIINAVLAGVFFAIMAWTWEMFLLIPLVLGAYFVLGTTLIYTKKGWQKAIDFVKLFLISFGIFAIMASLNYGTGWYEKAIGYASQSMTKIALALGLPESAGVGLVFSAIVLLGSFVIYIAYTNRTEEKRKSGAKTINIIVIILLYCSIIAMAVTFLSIPALFQETSVLGQTVGEENTGKQFFGIKYNALIILPALALLLIPIRLYRNKNEHLSLMIFFWIMITWFMAWYKLKFTYTFGLPIAAAAGLITVEIFYYLKDRSHAERKAVVLALGFMLLVGIASATIFVPDKIPHIEEGYPDWKSALLWMQDPANIPTDAKMFNWWDEGHWISFVGERAVSADNRNASFEANRDFGLFVVTSDLDEALNIVRIHNFDYIIFDSSMFLKVGSLGNYGYDTINSNDPRIVKFLIAPHAATQCSEESTGYYICGPNNLDAASMANIPAKWTTTSNQMYDNGQGVTIPLYIYRAEDNSELYITNPAINESMLGKLWFKNDEVMQYFEEVYSKQGMRIFKVNKEAVELLQ